MHNLNKESVQ